MLKWNQRFVDGKWKEKSGKKEKEEDIEKISKVSTEEDLQAADQQNPIWRFSTLCICSSEAQVSLFLAVHCSRFNPNRFFARLLLKGFGPPPAGVEAECWLQMTARNIIQFPELLVGILF